MPWSKPGTCRCDSMAFLSLYIRDTVPPGGVCILPETLEKRAFRGADHADLTQFADAMQAVSSALLAGYSMEHAWQESQKEMEQLWGRDSYIGRELAGMNTAVAMNEPLEKVLGEFAKRSGCEDIESFAEIFAFAKRGGGDFARIIRTTVLKLTDKIEVEQEIATVLAGKKLEGRIMNGMPLFILAYLNLTSGDFLAVLYGNPLGVVIMTGALAGYFAALRLSEHILDIHV